MEVTVEDRSSVKKILHIEVPEADVVRELDEAYKVLKKNAKVKGFRPGKAPRSVLERMFRKDVHSDVTSQLIQTSFVEALKETNLNIIGDPKIEPGVLDAKGPYTYDVTIELKPEIVDIDFKGVNLTKTMYKVSDGEIEGQIQMLRKNLAKRELIKEDRPVQDEDFAVIDYEGFMDDKPFADTPKIENFAMKVGVGSISKDFDEQVIGMKSKEYKEFQIKFPEDHIDKKLAGLEIDFKVVLVEIREEILPEVDTEFVKQLGPFESVEDLKLKISENMTEGYDKRMEQEINEQVFEQLIEKTDFELPEVMINYELDGIIEEAEKSFQASNVTMEQLGITKESLSEKYRETAENQVRRHLILSKIIEQEKMSISDDELEKGFSEISKTYNQPIESIKEFYSKNKDKLEYFKHTLLEKMALGVIIDSGNIEEQEPEEESVV